MVRVKQGLAIACLILALPGFTAAAQAQERLRLATTTSVQDSGSCRFC